VECLHVRFTFGKITNALWTHVRFETNKTFRTFARTMVAAAAAVKPDSNRENRPQLPVLAAEGRSRDRFLLAARHTEAAWRPWWWQIDALTSVFSGLYIKKPQHYYSSNQRLPILNGESSLYFILYFPFKIATGNLQSHCHHQLSHILHTKKQVFFITVLTEVSSLSK